MKKIFAILLTMVMVTGMFTGCDVGHDHDPTTAPTEVNTDPTIDESEAPVETTVPETEDPTEASTEAPTEAPTTMPTQESEADETNPVHQHSYERTVTTPPTCSYGGEATYTCSCGYSYTEAIPKNEHKWGEWVVTVEPTETTYGKKVRTCELCNGGQEANIDPLASDETEPPATEGDDDGYSSDDDIIDGWSCVMSGHRYGDWVVTKEPTETEYGEETRTCSKCDNIETRRVDKLLVTDCEANGYSHSISPADQVGYTRGADEYRVRCYCGHGARGATEEAALAAHNKHVETTDIDCNHGLEWIKVGHSHIAPSGTFICTKCRKEVAHSPIYAPNCDIIGCHD